MFGEMRRTMAYGYANARVKAMRPELLTKAQLEEMVAVDSIAAAIELLERTIYKEDLVALSLKHRDAALVEFALGRNFGKCASKVVRIAPKGARSTVEAVLERWDVQNLKMILYAKQLGKKREDIEQFIVPVGTIKPRALIEMIEADSMEQCAKGLRGNEYGAIISDGLRTKKSIEEICSAMDAHYYDSIGRKVSGTGREGRDARVVLALMKGEIDGRNVMNVLRCKVNKVDPKVALSLMIPGGDFSEGVLRDMVATEDVEKAAMLLRVGRGMEFKDAIEHYKKDGSLAHFEIAIENMIAKRGLRALRSSIMSVGALVGFLLLKEEEMNNVRKIVRMKQFGMPKERIKEMIVAV